MPARARTIAFVASCLNEEGNVGELYRRCLAAFEAFTAPAWQAEHPECGPIVAIDGTGDAATVAARVHAVLRPRLPELAVALGTHA